MPRLLQIDSCLGVGSTGRITENIASVVREHGWETYIVHGSRYVGKTTQKSISANTIVDEYVHIAKSLILDNHGLNSKRQTSLLIKKIEEIHPDIIHIHCIHGYYINYEILFRFLAEYNVPVIWTQHDCWAFTGHCAHFDSIGCKKWETGCYECPLKKGYPRSLLLDRSKRNWELKREIFNRVENLTIISVSQWLNNQVSKSFLSNKKHICIYNGIDTASFQFRVSNIREKYNLKKKYILLAVATAWSDSKGLTDYIELSRYLNYDEQIVLIGITERSRRQLPKSIIGLPKTNDTIELSEWYSVADIVLNLSHQETFGLTTVEGMSCGTPGIVYNCTASPELITPETGLAVAPGAIIDVREAISKLRKESIVSSEKCRNRVLDNFEMHSQFTKYLELYKSILNDSSKKPPDN